MRRRSRSSPWTRFAMRKDTSRQPDIGFYSTDSAVWVYTYDARGDVLTKTLSDSASPSVVLQQTTNTYDHLGQLLTATQLNTPTSSVWRYTYDNVGNKKTATDPNGNQTQYSYDNLNRLILQTNPDTSTDTFVYDLVGNVTTRSVTGTSYSNGLQASTALTSIKFLYQGL